MSKNKVQFQKGYGLVDFIKDYGTEEQYGQALFKWRWPDGFRCPDCGSDRYTVIKARNLSQCSKCRHPASLISGTIFGQTKLPLTNWFLAMHLITQAKTGLSALVPERQIGMSYNTAWGIKQKIMQVMKERDNSKPLSGIIQLDDGYWGGERRGGKMGRGSENKTPFVAAVAMDENGHPLSMNMNVVKGFRTTEITRRGKRHLAPASLVCSVGLTCFSAVKTAKCDHYTILRAAARKVLPVKNSHGLTPG